MTSEEIKAKLPTDISSTQWLKEIAYQLALQNERQAKQPKPNAQR